MKSFFSRLFLGYRATTQPYNAISDHLAMIEKVWEGKQHKDIGLERVFRLLLLSVKFGFPGLYLEYLSGKLSKDARLVVSEIYVLVKAVFPLWVLCSGKAGVFFWYYVIIYLLVETFLAIFNRIYLSEHFDEEGYKRMLLLLFLNFAEVVFSFAVLYSMGRHLMHPFKSHMDAIYFSMMTSSTIAYGDNFPVTDTGKFISVLQAMSTLVFLGLFFNFFNSRLKD